MAYPWRKPPRNNPINRAGCDPRLWLINLTNIIQIKRAFELWHSPSQWPHSQCDAKKSDNCIWKSRLSLSTKLKLYNVCILPIMLYGSECWALSKADARKVDALDQWCLRRILDIRWYHRVFNCEVRRLTEQPPLTTIIQKRRLMLFFGHLVRMCNERSSFANASFFHWSLERLDTPIKVVQSQWRYSTVRKRFISYYFSIVKNCL